MKLEYTGNAMFIATGYLQLSVRVYSRDNNSLNSFNLRDFASNYTTEADNNLAVISFANETILKFFDSLMIVDRCRRLIRFTLEKHI